MTMTERQRLKAMANELMAAGESCTQAAEALDRYRNLLKTTSPEEAFFAGCTYSHIETLKGIAQELVWDAADLGEDPRTEERPYRTEEEYRWTP